MKDTKYTANKKTLKNVKKAYFDFKKIYNVKTI